MQLDQLHKLAPENSLEQNGFPPLILMFACKYASTEDGLACGFRQLGWDVWPIDPQMSLPINKHILLKGLNRLMRPFLRTDFNNSILRLIQNISPSAFVSVKGSNISIDLLEWMRKEGIIRIMYYPDFHFDHQDVDIKTLKHYDFVFTTKRFQVPFLEKMLGVNKVKHLDHGYSSHVHYPRKKFVNEHEYRCDISYIGSHSSYKEDWLCKLKQLQPDLNLLIAGPGWIERNKSFEIKDCILGHVYHGDNYARAIQLSRINLSIHWGTIGKNKWQDDVSTRTFEIPACKGFMLHKDNQEVRTLFNVGSEIDVFKTHEELLEKIHYYLKNRDLREKMIEAAYSRCVPHYSYDIRSKLIAEIINANLTKNS